MRVVSISLASFFLVSNLAQHAAAATVEIWYNITYTTANPDGTGDRRAIGLNGTWP